MNCACVKGNEVIYLIQVANKGQNKNKHGQACLEVVGEAIFKGNHFIPHGVFGDFEKYHCVSGLEYTRMRKGWKKEKGGCIAWELELSKKYDNPVWLPHKSQERAETQKNKRYVLHTYKTHDWFGYCHCQENK